MISVLPRTEIRAMWLSYILTGVLKFEPYYIYAARVPCSETAQLSVADIETQEDHAAKSVCFARCVR